MASESRVVVVPQTGKLLSGHGFDHSQNGLHMKKVRTEVMKLVGLTFVQKPHKKPTAD